MVVAHTSSSVWSHVQEVLKTKRQIEQEDSEHDIPSCSSWQMGGYGRTYEVMAYLSSRPGRSNYDSSSGDIGNW